MDFNGEGNSAEARQDDKICNRSRVSIRRVEVAPAPEPPVAPSFSGQSGPTNIENPDNTLENTEAPNLPDVEVSNARQVQCETHEETIVPDETHEASPIEVEENMTSEPNSAGAERTMGAVNDRSLRKPKKYVSLSGLLKELPSPIVDFNVCSDIERPHKNVNPNFTEECEDVDVIPLNGQNGDSKNKGKRVRIAEPCSLKKSKRSKNEIRQLSSWLLHENDGASTSRSRSRRTTFRTEKDTTSEEREIANFMAELRSRAEMENLIELAEATVNAQMSSPQENQSVDLGQSQPSPNVNKESASALGRNGDEPMSMMELLIMVESRVSTNTPSMAAPQEPLVSAYTHHIFSAEELSRALSSVQMGDQSDRSMESQHHVEVNVINGGTQDGDAERRLELETSKCSLNRNPAELSDSEDDFMREC